MLSSTKHYIKCSLIDIYAFLLPADKQDFSTLMYSLNHSNKLEWGDFPAPNIILLTILYQSMYSNTVTVGYCPKGPTYPGFAVMTPQLVDTSVILISTCLSNMSAPLRSPHITVKRLSLGQLVATATSSS